jgi:hypothetical protein
MILKVSIFFKVLSTHWFNLHLYVEAMNCHCQFCFEVHGFFIVGIITIFICLNAPLDYIACFELLLSRQLRTLNAWIYSA